MTVKYCWSYADNDAIGDFDSREDAVADFERSLVEEDYDLEVGADVEVVTYKCRDVTDSIRSEHSAQLGAVIDGIINGYADYYLGNYREDTPLGSDDSDTLVGVILDWYKNNTKLGTLQNVYHPDWHTVTVPDND